ncbi:DUF4843 domain-containing protein [Pedobacter gandavensis]|uniref:DUF4843 domain-containing protein n=1 Tax=Pedobacter gandavensis TaxID=2679963 RepID=UPI00292FA216|nr:DUF4843 domain-containing protein [Pedobacter gandavensis]
MKRYIYAIFSLFLFGSIFSSCKKGLKDFDGTTGIYFLRAVEPLKKDGALLDSTVVSFGYTTATTTDSTILIPVRISGAPLNTERSYQLSIDTSSTAVRNQHYQILNTKISIPANQVTDTLKVKLIRTTDMQTNSFKLILNLKSNEHFKTTMQDQVIDLATGRKLSFISHRIQVTDLLIKPKAWLDTYLGTFSRKKLYLMAEVMSIKNLSVLDDRKLTNPGHLIYYGSFMQRYLNELEAKGETIYDEDKSKMKMGPAVQ